MSEKSYSMLRFYIAHVATSMRIEIEMVLQNPSMNM